MTETTTSTTNLPSNPAPETPFRPSDMMLNLVGGLLAPMFAGATGGDLRLAHAAAIETLNTYPLRNHAELLSVAQIVAFGLAALGSLGLSMADNLSVSMTLRLRGTAVALNRSAEHSRRALITTPTAIAAPKARATNPQPSRQAPHAAAATAQRQAVAAAARTQTPENAPAPASPASSAAKIAAPPEQDHRAMWAQAFSDVAGEFDASLRFPPPEEPNPASRKAAATTSSLAALLSGQPLPKPAAPPANAQANAA